jgi:tetratricopeptide (TPR) repeat protein
MRKKSKPRLIGENHLRRKQAVGCELLCFFMVVRCVIGEKEDKLVLLEEEMKNEERLNTQMAMAKRLESSDYLKSCAAFEEALGLAIQLKNQLKEAQCHEGMARMLWKLSDNSKAHKRYRVALGIYIQLGDQYGMATSYSGLGIISSLSEDYSTSLDFFEQALSASRKAEHHSFTAVLIANIGNVYFLLGRYEGAMECYKRALKYHEVHDNFVEIAIMLIGMASVHIFTREYNEGLKLLHRALVIDRKAGRTQGVLMCVYNIGETYRKQGKTTESLKKLLEALKFAEKMNARATIYKIHEQLSGLYTELDESEKSAHHLQLFMEAEEEQHKWVVKKENEKLQKFGGS